MKKTYFGKLKDGSDAWLYEITNSHNVTLKVSDFGATWVGLEFPDRDGIAKNVILGYDTAQEYADQGYFFGATVGRSGNRIAEGKFTINGVEYQMNINDNDNNLHSGMNYYHTRKWAVKDADDAAGSISFRLLTGDGDQGFPGNFDVTVTYTLSEDNKVSIHYEGISDADTVANMTNHSYFNLAGDDSGSILDQELKLNAEYYTPVSDSQSIPTGEYAPVEGTPMDFRKFKRIGQDIDADFAQLKFTGGYDHNYAPSREKGETRVIAEAYAEKTGIAMEVFTDLPGVQFYAGNFIKDHRGRGGAVYSRRQGFCLETQFYPNSVNQEGFASPVLKAGEKYDTTTSYRFFVR